LLSPQKDRGSATAALRYRVAHLLGASIDNRKEIYQLVKELYILRSEMVHAGTSSSITEHDVKLAKDVARAALRAVLIHPRVARMRDKQQFETWLDGALLRGEPEQ